MPEFPYGPIMAYDPAEHVILFGEKACQACGYAHEHYGIQVGHRVRFGSTPCTKCNGTGKRGSGQCGTCNRRGAYRSPDAPPVGRVRDLNQPIDDGPCPLCDATGKEKATAYDYVPKSDMVEIMTVMPVRVVRAGRDLTYGETLLGVLLDGSIGDEYRVIYTCADYGTAWGQLRDGDPATVIARVRTSMYDTGHQAINIATQDGRVADAVTVAVSANGYTVLAWFDLDKS